MHSLTTGQHLYIGNHKYEFMQPLWTQRKLNASLGSEWNTLCALYWMLFCPNTLETQSLDIAGIFLFFVFCFFFYYKCQVILHS